MNLLRRVISAEIGHFRNLSNEGQKLAISLFLFNLANPIIWSFATAFVWRESNSMSIVAFYNVAIFGGIPVGFYLNGKLLEHYAPNILYFYGCILSGVSIMLLMLFPFSLVSILAFGFLFGLTGSLFWANKNFLNLKVIKSANRVYFSGLEQIFGIISGIIVPLFVGWFIVFGSHTNWYTSRIAYQLLSIVTVGILYYAGVVVKRIPTEKVHVKNLTFVTSCKSWFKIRVVTFTMGLSNGIEAVLPTLMVLTLVGKEDSLGAIQSLSGIFLAVTVYQVVKKVDKHFRVYIFAAGVFSSLLAAFLFSFYFSFFGVLCYFILNAIGGAFKWSTVTPINFDMMDFEEKWHARHQYASIFDQQLFLNIGRNAGVFSFLLLIPSGSHEALRFTPLLFAVPQILLLWLLSSVEKRMLTNDIRERSLRFRYLQARYLE